MTSPALPEKYQRTLDCLRQVHHDTLEKKRRLGHYAVLWRDGKVIAVGEDAPTEPREGHSTNQPSLATGQAENNPFPPCELDAETDAIYQEILVKRPDVEKLGIDTGLLEIESGPQEGEVILTYATVEQAEEQYRGLSANGSKEHFSLKGNQIRFAPPGKSQS